MVVVNLSGDTALIHQRGYVSAWSLEIITTHWQPTKLQKTVMRAHVELPSARKSKTFNGEYLQDSFFGKLVQSCGLIFTFDALIKSNSA